MPVLVVDPTKAHAKSVKTQPTALGAVVTLVMVVAVETAGYAQGAGQLIDGGKAVRVGAAGFVGGENIGAQGFEALAVAWENGAAVLEWQAFAPLIAFAAPGEVLLWTLKDCRCRRCPHFAPEHSAQPGNA